MAASLIRLQATEVLHTEEGLNENDVKNHGTPMAIRIHRQFAFNEVSPFSPIDTII